MADNLESYFKKKLSEDTPGDGNWNVPSDKVWENVLPKIQKKRGLFIPWRYFYLLGILLLAGTLSVFWFLKNPDNISDNNDAIAQVETDRSIQNPQHPGVINTTANNENKETTVKTEIKTESVVFGENQISTQENAEIIESDKSTVGVVSSEKVMVSGGGIATPDPPNNFYPENQSNSQVNNISKETIRDRNQMSQLNKKSIEDISSADDLTIEEKDILTEPDNNDLQSATKEPLNNKGRFGIGAFFAPTFNATSIDGDPLRGAIETGDMLMYSNNWRFEFRYFISNRFTLVTGIGKSDIKSWSKSLIEFGYDTSTEHTMPTGEKENTSAVPMQTPFGEIDTEITYRFSGDEEIPDGELMYSAMETHQDIRYLSIPLGVEFNIIRFSRFNWFVEGGIRYNRALKDATKFTSRILHDGNDMDVVHEEMTSHPSYTENYLNFYIGTGVNYQFSKSFQISGSARYFGNITKVNLQDNMSTYVHGFDLKLGIIYIF